MTMAGSVSPTWSNADADDFWDDDLGALDDDLDLAGTDHVDAVAEPVPQKHRLETTQKDGKSGVIDSTNETLKPEVAAKSGVPEQEVDESAESGQNVSALPIDPQNTLDIQDEHTEISADEEIEQVPRVGFPVQTVPHAHSVPEGSKGDEAQDGAPKSDVTEKGGIDETPEVEQNGPAENAVNGHRPVDMLEPEQLGQPEKEETEIEHVQDHKDQASGVDEGHATLSQKGSKSEAEQPVALTLASPLEDADMHQSNGSHAKNPAASSILEPLKRSEDQNPRSVETPEDSQASGVSLTAQIQQLKLELAQKDEMLSQVSKGALQNSEITEADTTTSERYELLEQTLRKTEQERDHAQEQLEGFLSKISSMKTVFQNFKATQNELEEVRGELAQVSEEKDEAVNNANVLSKRVFELEAHHADSAKDKELHSAEIKKHLSVIDSLKSEALDLNSECDRLSSLLGTLRREFSAKEETLQDEKYALENEVSRLNKKLSEHRSAHGELELEKEEAMVENKNLALAVEELKERLSERDGELEKQKVHGAELKAAFESQIDELQRAIDGKNADIKSTHAKVQSLENDITALQQDSSKKAEEIEKLLKENEKIKTLEEDAQTKQLAIGKLRHEAIILNEHLTKSISMLKQNSGDSDQTVDRELVSNLILNFLQIPWGDTKKFEALSLIGGLLDWDDKKKIQAGLMHSAKNDENKPSRSGLISLWADFLDKESTKK